MTHTPTAKLALADTKPAATVTDALGVALAPGRGKKADVIAPGLSAAVRTRLAEAFAAMGATGKAGEVTRIDRTQGQLTLKHGPVPNLDMPAMTMAYRVQDPGWLDQLKVGDRVRFDADKVGGQFTVLRLTIQR